MRRRPSTRPADQRSAPLRARLRSASDPVSGIDQAEVARHEFYDVPAALVRGSADRFSGQRLLEEDVLAVPLDRVVGAHPPHLVIGVVPGHFDLRLQGVSRHRPVARVRRPSVAGLTTNSHALLIFTHSERKDLMCR